MSAFFFLFLSFLCCIILFRAVVSSLFLLLSALFKVHLEVSSSSPQNPTGMQHIHPFRGLKAEHHTSLPSLTFPERLRRPEDPEGWCCSYPRRQSCAVYQTRSNTFKYTIYEAYMELLPSIIIPSVRIWLRLLSHLSLEFICRAFASILAPMSPMAFPLMSNLVSVELLPSAFSTMDRSLFSLESARDREVRGWRVSRDRERDR